MKKIFIIIPLLLLLASCSISDITTETDSKTTTIDTNTNLEVTYLNVGKGDAIILNKDDTFVVIDCGYSSTFNILNNALEEKGCNKIDYLIITHFDKDHLGSASNILNNFEVDHIIQSNYPKDSKTYDNYINVIKKKKISPITCRVPMTFNLNELSISIIPPALEEYETKPSNNSSLITSITFKDTNYLFTGDIENDRIKEFVASNKTSYDFLKVPYHGHYQDNLKDLLDNVKAKYFVITSSDEEKEDDETINLINSSNIYLTRKGNIILNSDGISIDIRYE